MKHLPSILGAAALLFAGLAPAPSVSADQTPGKTAPGMTADVKPATSFTAKANASVYGELDFGNRQEHEFATRGLIDAPEKLELKDESGRIIRLRLPR
jgi:alkyl sulfatase BDS1-like metallo-beta-lactamase superfamily hydrolase